MAATEFPIKATMIADSVNEDGIRLSTMQLRYPRLVHAEFMTHRVFTRNGRSSRAVPVVTMMEEAKNPYVPKFLKNQSGMVASEEFTPEEFDEIEARWRALAEHTRQEVAWFQARGVHKQWANRPLEWFGYIDVLVSSTYWLNWDTLRIDPAAQPEIQYLADAMKELRQVSVPQVLEPGQWHLPYVTEDERYNYCIETLRKLSTARCARLTYKPFDGNDSIEAEIQRYERLVVSQPVHASPAEHQATPDAVAWRRRNGSPVYGRPNLSGNFAAGWIQHRKLITNEAVMEGY